MSFRIRNLMADVGPRLFADACTNSGVNPPPNPDCDPSCPHASRKDGTGCTNSGTATGQGRHALDQEGHGRFREALPLLRLQLREALGAGA
jgi:hypothetical protein